jgi:Na+/H+ antiporter NhaD and related arsenite permeases
VRVRWNGWLLIKSLVITLTAVALFFAGQPPAKVAITAGALLLLTRRLKPERVYREIDWSLLLLFAGLFIVVRGMEAAVLSPELLAQAQGLHLDQPAMLAAVAAILSNLVSNVPAVLVLKPFVQGLADPHPRLARARHGLDPGGNFTILGSVANLIVVERARRQNIEISFWSYFRIGAPLTLITIVIGVLMLG